jgi:hypothetical protein
MRNQVADIQLRIRDLVWAAAVLAAAQPGCTVMHSSCDGFESQRMETRVPLPVDDAGQTDAGAPATPDECVMFCQSHEAGFGTQYACTTEAADGGGTVVVCSFNTVCEGRRPDGFSPPEIDARTPLLGRYFAAMAATEAASVTAFERMAEELAEHHMPVELQARARRAALEEARHWRMTAMLARRFGARAHRGAVATQPPRSLLQMAIENAREGVVRETFGAAVGWWQALHAGDQLIRRVMRRIANDESSHAALSWAVDAAARERLTAAERSELDAATAAALALMEREMEAPVPDELVHRAGLPSVRVARALLDEARAQLWS